MNYLLDTNICIHFFRGRHEIKHRIKDAGFGQCRISEITWAELLFGAEASKRPDHHKAILDDFLEHVPIIQIEKAIPLYAKEKARLIKIGMRVDDLDLLIGATALAHDLTMVTENVKHFQRMENLKLENWVSRS